MRMPRSDGRRALLLTTILMAALLFAGGLAALGVVASRSLLDRDRAVREGTLLRLAHALETELREHGPDDTNARLNAFLRAHADDVSGIQIDGPLGTIAKAGDVGQDPVETSVALGPAWRGLAGGAGFGRGSPPFRLRMSASAALGSHRRLARVVVIASATAAIALFVLATLAALGMLEHERRLELQSEQRELELTALAGAGLAHRIRTPLATIKGTAQMIEGNEARVRRIVTESERVDAMIRRLLEFARPPEPNPEPFDLVPIVKRIAGVRYTGPETLQAFADPEHVETVLQELVDNARAFDGGTIEVVVTPNGASRRIEVRDRGAGLSIAPDSALDPYVTTRADGTGLGLAIANALVRSNGGTLTLANRHGGGCVANVEIPAEAR